ncbi:glycosyltransferase family 2 protein [Pseudohoeflea coraliihabitans]|uniref:Glycosyltransferase n=1 Tax=Pseudohoeflea coraliihabitans TaxID=2860393 RepID=A0ABS6WPF1_9HYPH|nr:glycosyltransferase [Pseudohoeflea sp. DP4N28-3]MBW3097272.1 glycosyltransferase [Pseudohoeflea sp. DP4N28-3]
MPAGEFEPLVSIVIPVYNGANYLARAIDSALAQTYPRIEIIVVNDGSSDEGATAAIARRYGSRISYIEKENGGCGSALNAGIAAMSGSYFSWLSHDDLYLPTKVAHQVSVLCSLEDRQTILFGPYQLIDENDRSKGFVCPHETASHEQLSKPLFALSRGAVHGCTLLIPRTCFPSDRPFDESLACTQDYDLWLRMFPRAAVHYDPAILVQSRVHPAQGSKTIPTAVEEGEALWRRFVTEVSPAEAERTEGTHYRYLMHLAAFLAATPYAAVAPLASDTARKVLQSTLISVIIPFRNRIDWTIEAVRSVLAQDHRNLELLLVDDGSDDDVGPLRDIAESDPRLRCFRQAPMGAASARNFGVRQARGSYVAFLDSDDRFCDGKLSLQLAHMLREDLAFSHTSYEVSREEGSAETIDTSYFAGQVYPAIIATCPIATPTVMLRRDVALHHPFPEALTVGEDGVAWIDIAAHHALGAIPAALTRVRLSRQSASVDPQRYRAGIANILAHCLQHPAHAGHKPELSQLAEALSLDLRRGASSLVQHKKIWRSPFALPLAATDIWRLLRRGTTSLLRLGPATTWRRARAWYIRRRMLHRL